MAMPICSPASQRLVLGGSAATISSSLASAGLPASSSSTLSSAAVTTIVGPIGRQPWLTTVRAPTAPPRNTPTAPRSYTLPSAISRVEPCPRRPGGHATDQRQAGQRLVEPLDEGVGRERVGIGEQHRDLVVGVRSGRPTTASAPRRASPRGGTADRTSGSTRGPDADRGVSSTPRPPPITPAALQPSTARRRSGRQTRSRAPATASGSAPQTNKQTRSGGWPPNGSSAWRVASRRRAPGRRPRPDHRRTAPSGILAPIVGRSQPERSRSRKGRAPVVPSSHDPTEHPGRRLRAADRPRRSRAPSRPRSATTCSTGCAPAQPRFPGIVGFDDTVLPAARTRAARRARPRAARRARPGQDPADPHARRAARRVDARWSTAARSTTTPTRRSAPLPAAARRARRRPAGGLAAPRRAVRREARDPRHQRRRPDRRHRPDQGRRGPHARRPGDRALRPGPAHQPRHLLRQRAARPGRAHPGGAAQRAGGARHPGPRLPAAAAARPPAGREREPRGLHQPRPDHHAAEGPVRRRDPHALPAASSTTRSR